MRQELAIAAGAASIGAALWALRGRLRQKAKPADLEQWRVEFLDFCLECGVLLFGDFTLKSGRKCPFFFNAGNFKTGGQLARLGEYYAVAVAESKVPYDVLFGPAYKGIPLVAATAVALAKHHGVEMPYCYNRKEAKDHGEGGVIVGGPLKGGALVLDDVITAGTAARESASIIREQGARLAGIVIALDREEHSTTDTSCSSVEQLERELGVPIVRLATVTHLIAYLKLKGELQMAERVAAHNKQYAPKRSPPPPPGALPLVFVAVDTTDLDAACKLSATLAREPALGIKLGLEFFSRHGAAGVEKVMKAAAAVTGVRRTAFFVDLKFHDIPNTVAGAVRAIASLGAAVINVHSGGGPAMMKAAVAAAAEGASSTGTGGVATPAVIAVTVLTSMDDGDLEAVGQRPPSRDQVVRLASLAKECGMDGVVCSAQEIAAIRAACGPAFKLIVPGIRPAGAAVGDQKRVMTPGEAITAGGAATALVVGRPITSAPSPMAAAAAIVAEVKAAMPPQPKHIDKLALVHVKDRKQLVVRSKGKGSFFTPGGKREAGESDAQALIRECREELSVELKPGSLKPYGVFQAQAHGKPEGTMVIMTCFTAEFEDEKTLAPANEIEEMRWIESSEASCVSATSALILHDLKVKGLID